jgi:hypothetical protein
LQVKKYRRCPGKEAKSNKEILHPQEETKQVKYRHIAQKKTKE